jgi:hypothetical protein
MGNPKNWSLRSDNISSITFLFVLIDSNNTNMNNKHSKVTTLSSHYFVILSFDFFL